jgi:DnaJ-class molecular chaperone
MKFKKIEEMDYYEILNVKRSASQQEILRAYNLCRSTYHHGSIAFYSLLNEEDRNLIAQKVDEAFRTLGDPEKRKEYDANTLEYKLPSPDSVYYRHSTQKLLIEDGEKKDLFKKIKRFFCPSTKNSRKTS